MERPRRKTTVWSVSALVTGLLLSLSVLSEGFALTINFDPGTFVDGVDGSPDEDVRSLSFRFHDEHPFNEPPDPIDPPLNEDAEVNTVTSESLGVEDNRVTVDQFGGILTMTQDSGLPFDLESFRLSNFTFGSSHTHAAQVVYHFADSTSITSPVYTVGTEIPGDRALESEPIVVNYTGLVSVEFHNVLGSGGPATGRKFFVDDIVVAVPEPAALGTVVLGLGLAIGRRRR